MTRRPQPSKAAGVPAAKLNVERVRVNREGYDASGAYWGAGKDVFIVTSTDGSEELTLRAANITEARQRAMAELAGSRPLKAEKERIGGAPSRKTRYQFDWQEPVSRATITIRVTQSRDYLVPGTDHIEVESVKPKRAALPITDTGYRSHFMPALELINAGGAVTFVKAWLDEEAAAKPWQKRQQTRQQGDLFQWAETQAEIAKPRRVTPARPAVAKTARAKPKPTPR